MAVSEMPLPGGHRDRPVRVGAQVFRPARPWSKTVLTLTHSRYAPRQSHAHQKFSKAMSSVANDFRLLTPLVLLEAVRRAGTVVCEPIHRYVLESPANVLEAAIPALARLAAPPLTQNAKGIECTFHSYRPVHGAPPERPRVDHNPLNRVECLASILGMI